MKTNECIELDSEVANVADVHGRNMTSWTEKLHNQKILETARSSALAYQTLLTSLHKCVSSQTSTPHIAEKRIEIDKLHNLLAEDLKLITLYRAGFKILTIEDSYS